MKGRWWKGLTLAALLLGMVQSLSAQDVGIGGALGLRVYQSDGGVFSNSQIEGDVFIDGEVFGIKLFADFSFYNSKNSTVNNSYAVTYNTETSSTKEGFGVAPYYFFKKNERLKVYAGPLVAVNFYQTETSYDFPANSTADYKVEMSYMACDIGLFAGAKYTATSSLEVFFEFPLTTQLARSTTTYKKDGTDLKDFVSKSFGTGGSTAFRTCIEPKLGLSYRM